VRVALNFPNEVTCFPFEFLLFCKKSNVHIPLGYITSEFIIYFNISHFVSTSVCSLSVLSLCYVVSYLRR